MRQFVGKLAFCLVFIFLMILAILEHEAIQPVMSGAVSEFPSIQYISQKEAQQLIAKTKGIVIIDVRNNTEYIQLIFQCENLMSTFLNWKSIKINLLLFIVIKVIAVKL